ncbi:MAG TPA: hypothetical protein PKD59_07400 [Miltoncostaeaceae bacterium]|nr:hypothetical protein [Miltoncostaeaceae bacterium]
MPDKIVPGRVYAFRSGFPQPPTSSLADAFFAQDGLLADAVVLRGYLGRSPILSRTKQYLERARKAVEEAKAPGPKERENLAAPEDAPYIAGAKEIVVGPGGKALTPDEQIASIDDLLGKLEAVRKPAGPHVPWRIYLTPTLNRWVDFHLSSLLAWRQEPKAERKDTFTVWLQGFTDGQPVPYRIVEETLIGPTFSTYLGGDLIDDFLGDSASSGSAWGDQSAPYGGGRPGTKQFCLNG